MGSWILAPRSGKAADLWTWPVPRHNRNRRTPILRRAIDDALNTRWLAQAPDSGPWPCEPGGAAAVTLCEPDGAAKGFEDRKDDAAWIPKGARTGAADLEPNELQDLMDVLLEVITAAAGVPVRFHFRVTLVDGGDVAPEAATSVNELLEHVNPKLRLT